VNVEGEVVRVTYESDSSGFRVVRVREDGGGERILVGVFQQLLPGSRVRATGRIESDPRHGEQLRVESVLAIAPSTLEGLERYLASGKIPGVGQAFAKRIVATFGDRTLDALDRGADALREVPGLGRPRAEGIAKAWAEQRAVSGILVFLQSHGVSPGLAGRVYKRFGSGAVDIVSRQPYRLALDVWGVGFKTADRIARSLGIPEDSPERRQAGVLQTLLDRVERGHVYLPSGELTTGAALLLECDVNEADVALRELAAHGRVRIERVATGEEAVYPLPLHEAEVAVARRLAALARAEPVDERRKTPLRELEADALAAFEAKGGLVLAPAQRAAIEAAARHKVLVITGGPGVGKTTIVRALLSLFERAKLVVRLAAPTGRAAKRMAEATGLEATTIHRLLEIDARTREFSRNEKNPLLTDVLVVDEASMVDLELGAALLAAVPPAARLVLVGDVDQLPSVGPGAVLRDIIASGVVPTVRLTQIFRQAEGSLIVQNAHRIHEGLPPETDRGREGQFYVFERTTGESAAETIKELVTKRIPEGFGIDAVRDIQVLSPMNRGDAGAIALNTLLQAALNPEGPSVRRGAQIFRVGDKVMQLKNDYDREIYNGDLGRIVALVEAEKKLVVRFDEREVDVTEEDLDELSLAYATTIHKSQGSEYPVVVVPLLMQHFVMLAKNLLYTAVTRGKRLVVLVADPKALHMALRSDGRDARWSALAARLVAEFEGASARLDDASPA
jgi:exodeoxyribonuclease V alpha subunit